MKNRAVRIISSLLILAILAAGCISPQTHPAATVTLAPSATMANSPTTAPSPTTQPTDTPAPTVTLAPSPTAAANPSYWWNSAVFYEIFVRSFFDGTGDGKGDFKGLTAKLDYLNDGNPNSTTSLGVKALWLLPIQPSPLYDGYDITDYSAVNQDYGTMNDFKTFLQEAHKRGIKVIIDFVPNDTSKQNPWFISAQDPKSDKRDWFVWSDKDPGYNGPWNEQVWYQAVAGFYYAIFNPETPDLNYRNPAVNTAMDNVVSFWLKDVGVDGFRIDGAPYIIEDGSTQADTPETHAWYKALRTFYKAINPDAFTVGEVWESVFSASAYAQGDELDTVFAFDMASAMVNDVNGGNGSQASDDILFNSSKFKPNQFGTFLTNHDMSRAFSQLGGDMGKMKSAATIYLTAPGVPFIYYGEEIGMSGVKGSGADADESDRSPMQWSSAANGGFTTGSPWWPVNSDLTTVNVASETSDPNSLLAFYRQLVHLRNEQVALQSGDYLKVAGSDSSIYAALRTSGDDIVLVVSNLNSNPIKSATLSLAKGALSGSYQVTPLLGSGTFANLTSNAAGGFDNYPMPADLPAGGNDILLLKPAK